MGTEIDLPQILSHPLLVEKYLQNNGNGRSPAWPGPDLRPYLDFEANLTRLFDDTTAEEIRFQRRGPPGKKSRLDDDDLDPWQGIGDRKVVLSALSQDTPSSTAPTFAMSMGSFFEPSSKRSHPSISSSGSLSGFSDPPSSSTSDSSSLSFFSSASDSAASNSTDYGKEMSGPPSSRAPRTPLELARHSNLSSNAPEFVPTRAFFPPPSDSSYGQRIQTQQQPPPPPPRSRIYRTYAQSSGDGFYVRSFASERLLQKEKSQPQSGFQSLPPPPPMITGKFAGSSSSRSSAAGSLLPLVPRLTAMRPQPPREKDIKGHHASSSRHNSHKMNSRFYRGTDRNTGDDNGTRISSTSLSSGSAVSYISSRKLVEKKGSCSFCRQRGEPREIYDSHCLRNPISNEVMCPNFGVYACKFCDHQSCDLLHTTDKCPILLGYKSKKMGKIPTPLLSSS